MTDELNKEIRTLKMQIAKLQLESKLRRNLASELDKHCLLYTSDAADE